MPRGMAILLICLAVTMIGFGVTLPVLPFFVERVAAAGGPRDITPAVQIGLLTAVLPLMQLLAAPLWGRWSDTVGRKRLVVIGIGGMALGQVLFGLAPTLTALYGARIVGGLLSAAILPAATAYVADITTPAERGRGMAWLGTAVSLGVIAGPALGGLLVRRDFHWQGLGHFAVSGFSLPFLASAALALVALAAALCWLPESRPPGAQTAINSARGAMTRALARRDLRLLLILVALGQLGLASFETTFALYAQRRWDYGPGQVGAAFMTCGLVMAISQTGLAVLLASRVREILQVAAGFALTGTGLGLILVVRDTPAVLGTVAVIALGNAFLAPNLAAMVSRRGASATGAVLGTQSAAGSFGQLAGTLAGAALFSWNVASPFALGGGLLLAVGAAIAWRSLRAPAANGR